MAEELKKEEVEAEEEKVELTEEQKEVKTAMESDIKEAKKSKEKIKDILQQVDGGVAEAEILKQLTILNKRIEKIETLLKEGKLKKKKNGDYFDW
jgi:hypothetical protein